MTSGIVQYYGIRSYIVLYDLRTSGSPRRRGKSRRTRLLVTGECPGTPRGTLRARGRLAAPGVDLLGFRPDLQKVLHYPVIGSKIPWIFDLNLRSGLNRRTEPLGGGTAG